jgi:LPXTG-site transpeptidase (sortase) family protein
MNTLGNLIDQILARKVAFLVAFFVVFTFSYGVLFIIDFLPEAPSADTTANNNLPVVNESKASSIATSSIIYADQNNSTVVPGPKKSVIDNKNTSNKATAVASENLPILIKMPALNREVRVLNPSSRTIAAMNEALLSGVVRHPDSAALGQEGNMLLLGHSSYLPKVFNENFQAFNGIQNLKWGDTIVLESDNKVYTYQVKKVYEVKASYASVPIAMTGKKITLVTCNSFGAKEDRFIVEAEFVSVRSF